MQSVKVTFENGDHFVTSINGTDESILAYYKPGNTFNVGIGPSDNIQTVKTAEIVTERTLQQLVETTTQLTADEILNNRYHNNKIGWTETRLSFDEKQKALDMIAAKIGGRKPGQIRRALDRRPNHWAIKRFIFAIYNEKLMCSYCAGQDMSWEMADLRKYLYKL